MKNAILILFLLSSFYLGYSQKLIKGIKKEKKSPEEIARIKTDRLEKSLELSKAQKEAMYKVLLEKAENTKVIMEKYQPDIEKMRREIKAIKERLKPTLDAMKQEMKENKKLGKEKFEKILTEKQLEKVKHLHKNKRIKKRRKSKKKLDRKRDLWMDKHAPPPVE